MAAFPERLAAETIQAYDAFTTYCAMHTERSTATVGQKLGKSKTLMDRWSGEHQWSSRVRAYDADMAAAVAAEHTRRYLAELEAHRACCERASRALYAVAGTLLQRLSKEADTLELPPATLSIAARALVVAGDLEAHALGIDRLLPMLTAGAGGARDEV